MVIVRIEFGSFVLNLNKSTLLKEKGAYWVSVYHFGFKNDFYTSLNYPKKQAFVLFVKMANWFLTKRYISY